MDDDDDGNNTVLDSQTHDSAEELILNHIEECPAIFQSQQIGEPDLSKADKRRIAKCNLRDKPLHFLIKFGKYLKEEHLEFMSRKYETNHEVKLYVKTLKNSLNPRSKNVVKRNRRYEAIRRMESVGTYFSEEEMEKREPLLYHELVGQYLNEKEKLVKYQEATRNKIPTFSSFLIDKIEKDDLNRIIAQQKKEETVLDNTTNDLDTLQCIKEKNLKGKWGVDWEDEECNGIAKSKGKTRGHCLLNPEEKILLFEEFKSIMKNKFLCGLDADFSYSDVDSNSDYDCLDLISQDEEEKYFDDETSDSESTNACTDTGIEDY